MYNPNEPRVQSGPTAGQWTSFDATKALYEAASDKNKKITKEEEEAIKDFTQSWAYPKVQSFLRKGIEDEYVDHIDGIVKNMDSFLEKSDKFEKMTYRGLQFDKKDKGFGELIKGIKGKGILEDKGFMSTTADETVVKYFMDHPGKNSVFFKVKGKTGVDISKLARDEGEKEVLFGRKTKFKVVSYEEKDYGGIKHYNVNIEEL